MPIFLRSSLLSHYQQSSFLIPKVFVCVEHIICSVFIYIYRWFYKRARLLKTRPPRRGLNGSQFSTTVIDRGCGQCELASYMPNAYRNFLSITPFTGNIAFGVRGWACGHSQIFSAMTHILLNNQLISLVGTELRSRWVCCCCL